MNHCVDTVLFNDTKNDADTNKRQKWFFVCLCNSIEENAIDMYVTFFWHHYTNQTYLIKRKKKEKEETNN